MSAGAGFTRQLVRVALDAAERAPAAEARIRQCIVDWIAVILGSHRAPGSHLHPVALEPSGATDVLAGTSVRPDAAAAANAYHAHLLDFDDVHTEVPGHSGAPVIAAALATAERDDATIADLFAGIAAGVETVVRLGRTVGDDLFALGLHPTAVFGTVGAAVAAARTAGADEATLEDAVGLAALQASGAMTGFGSVGKPWQVGEAARKGMIAAAAAPQVPVHLPEQLSGPRGVLTLLARRSDPPVLGETRWSPAVAGTQFKSYASCFGTHAAIDAARSLRDGVGDAGDIAGVEILVGPEFEEVVINPAPTTELGAKFSVSSVVALTLLGSPPITEGFFDAVRASDAYRRIEAATTARADAGVAGAGAVVRVRTTSGRTLEAVRDEQDPVPPDQARPALVDKFQALVEPVLGAAAAGELLAVIEGVDRAAPARSLTSPLRRGGRHA